MGKVERKPQSLIPDQELLQSQKPLQLQRPLSEKTHGTKKTRRALRIRGLSKEVVRSLKLPYKDQFNRQGNLAQQYTIDWINHFQIIPDKEILARINASQFGVFMGKAHPKADLEKLSIVADFATWLFIYDDRIEKCANLDEIKALNARTLEILNGSRIREDDNALMKGLNNIVERIDATNPDPIWKARFIHDIRSYSRAICWEAQNRLAKRVPTLKEYKRMRPATSGTKIMFDLIEFVEEMTLPEEIYKSLIIRTIRLLGANLVNWENDFLSAMKEFLSDDVHNLIFVLKKDYDCSFESSFRKGKRLFKKDLKLFKKYHVAVRMGPLAKKVLDKVVLTYKEKSNSHGGMVEESTSEWIKRFKIVPKRKTLHKTNAFDSSILIGNAYPKADVKRLRIASDFLAWLSIFEDNIKNQSHKENVDEIIQRAFEILDGSDVLSRDIPLLKGLHDVVERINATGQSKIWKNRFRRHLKSFCRSAQWEASNQLNKTRPTVEEYLNRRSDTRRTKMMFDLIELIEGITISKEALKSREIKKIRRYGANLVNWEKDVLLSQNKFLNDDVNNLFSLLKKDNQCTLKTAFNIGRAQFRRQFRHFTKYQNQKNEQNDQVRKYIDGITNLVSAHYFWAKTAQKDYLLADERAGRYVHGIYDWLSAHHYWAKKSPRYRSIFAD